MGGGSFALGEERRRGDGSVPEHRRRGTMSVLIWACAPRPRRANAIMIFILVLSIERVL